MRYKTRLIRVTEGELQGGACTAFSFSPDTKQETVLAILMAPGVEVSLSFDNGANLIFHRLENSGFKGVPPTERYYWFSKDLQDKILKGTIHNKTATSFPNIPVYLLIKSTI